MMQTAVVTGATSGIGKAIALALARSGRKVFALGRRRDALNIIGDAPNIVPVCSDVTDRGELERWFGAESVDILVNNAGVMPQLTSFEEMSVEEIDRVIGINLTASIVLTRLVARGMRARGRGHIFFMSSTAGHAAFPRLAVYSATKAGLGAFAEGIRLDLAASHVRVTEIVAGRTETDLYKSLLNEEMRAAMYANGSAVQPEDVADMVLAVLALPETTCVSRFDIVPTRQATATGATGSGPVEKS